MRERRLIAIARAIGLTGLLISVDAGAADYRPMVCDAAQAYAGPHLHPPPGPDDLGVSGDLSGALDPATVTRLEAAFETVLRATKAHALTAAIGVPGRGVWTATRGSEAPLFYWASAGKQATAVVVLQMVEEGRLKLSDPISLWVKGVPNGEAITLETLLDHTSGLFSANEDSQVHEQHRRLDAEAELAVLRRHGAMFCPGARWRYSNSGYDLLGRVIEQVDGRPLDEAITRRIIAPLGLTGMRALSRRSSEADIAPPISDTAEPPIALTTPGAAGPLAASALDMMRFEQALLGGPLLKAETRALMLRRLYPMFDANTYYGLGIMVYDLPDAPQRLYWVGHSGGAPGVKAVIAYAPHRHAFVAVALTGDGAAEAAANRLLKALAGQSD